MMQFRKWHSDNPIYQGFMAAIGNAIIFAVAWGLPPGNPWKLQFEHFDPLPKVLHVLANGNVSIFGLVIVWKADILEAGLAEGGIWPFVRTHPVEPLQF